MKTQRVAALLFTALLLPLRSHAASDNQPTLVPQAEPATAAADRLDLRGQPSVAKTPPPPWAQDDASRRRPIRLEPRRSLVEQGVEESRQALIACQKGAYPGATVSASAVKVAGNEAQPDHCYRF